MSDLIRKSNIKIIDIPEGEEMEEGAERLFKEVIAENFPNLGRVLDMQVHEANRTPNYTTAKRPSLRHIILKLSKFNDRGKISRAAREKKISYEETSIRLLADFSAETLQDRRGWNDIFKILKDKNYYTRILYLVKLSFRYDGEIKAFPDRQKLRRFVTTGPALQNIMKGALLPETKRQRFTEL
uniref:Uncharacterized protein n=1 Tax=Equus caballus TaxID=9796 RepID=A0A9L0SMC2_HORSE